MGKHKNSHCMPGYSADLRALIAILRKSASSRLLRRADVLRKSNIVDRAQHWSSRRQQRWREELRVEAIAAYRRAIYRCAAFEDADGLLAIEKAYQRTFVVKRAAP